MNIQKSDILIPEKEYKNENWRLMEVIDAGDHETKVRYEDGTEINILTQSLVARVKYGYLIKK